jgi:hypothetical protein
MSKFGPKVSEGDGMGSEKNPDFLRDLLDLRELWFHEDIAREIDVSRALGLALESAWCAGALTTIGFAMATYAQGEAGSTVEARCLFVMRQAAARLDELERENHYGYDAPMVTPRQLRARIYAARARLAKARRGDDDDRRGVGTWLYPR